MARIAKFLAGKRILITGATGFLGQPLIEKILWSAPDVGKIYVLIRPKYKFGGRVLDAQKRLEKELYSSTAFTPRLQGRYREGLEDFLREKLVAVAGDISKQDLGIEEEELERLKGEIDVIINSAAVVSFDASLDDALELNIFGAGKVAELASGCNHAILVHVSTAYVSGAVVGDIPETLYHKDTSSKEKFPLRAISDIELEIKAIRGIISRASEKSEEDKYQKDLREALEKREKRAGGWDDSRRSEELEKLKTKLMKTNLVEEGMKWARERGWNDTYTYTKTLGEQQVLRKAGSARVAIVRPSVIESSLSEPSPGWLDGLRMADPLIVAIGKGRLRSLPLNPEVNLDIVPVDMVVNAILAEAASLYAQKTNEIRIIHVATGSEKPISMGDLYKHVYEYFRRTPLLDKQGVPIVIKKLSFPGRRLFRFQHQMKRLPMNFLDDALSRLPDFKAGKKLRRKIGSRKVAMDMLYYYGEIYEPYLNLGSTFRVDRALALYYELDKEDQVLFNFDVSRMNWRHYVQNIHIPGVKKYLLKMEGTGSFELGDIESGDDDFPTTIPELLESARERFTNKTALQIKRKGEWVRYTYSDVNKKAREVAEFLWSAGFRPGDHVVLFSENQPEWGINHMGAVMAGLAVVPIDAQTWTREVWSICRFNNAKALLASAKCMNRFSPEELRENENLDDPVPILNVDKFCQPFSSDKYPVNSKLKIDKTHIFEPPQAHPEDPVSVIYTTGTLDNPKGAVHNHRSFLANVRGVNHYIAARDDDKFLSVLPLYHTLEYTCGFLMGIHGGATITYLQSLKPKNILATMRETGATTMLGVPTLYNLIREDIERRILKSKKSFFKNGFLEGSRKINASLEKRFGRNLGRKMFAAVHEEFGGKIRVFVSGGSALGEDLFNYFNTLGMPIYEGYGLTETAPVLTVSPLHCGRAGSAGKPLPGVEIRLYHSDSDGVGEIIVRTPSLMKEYYKNPEATSEVVRDGWLHTGDLGWVDGDGYLYITGRIKDVIVTGAGKNVYPTDLEAIYRQLPGIEEICVFGIRSGLTEEVNAVICPSPEILAEEDKAKAEKILQKAIQTLARELPSYNRLQALHFVGQALHRDSEGGLDRARIKQELMEVSGRQPRTKKGLSLSREKDSKVSKRKLLLKELSRLSGLEAEEISEESHLYTDLGLDSLMALELLLSMEQNFGVIIPDEKAASMQTVKDVLDEVRRIGLKPDKQASPKVHRSTLSLRERPLIDRTILRMSFQALRNFSRTYFDLKLENESAIPESGAYILAANHASHLDTVVMISGLTHALGVRKSRRLHIIGARDYFFEGIFKSWFFSTCMNVVPIERDELSLNGLRQLSSILAAGEPILIFPEGTRSRSGQIQEFKPGVGLVAWEQKVPILPVYLDGTYDAMPAGKSLPKRTPISVVFGNMIKMREYERVAAATTKDHLYRSITADVKTAIETMKKAAGG